MYLKLWQTFFPAGSSVCEVDNEQQSRALRAQRRSFISTQSPKLKPGTKYLSVSRLYVPTSFFPLNLFSFHSEGAQWEAVSLFLSTLHPSLLLSLLWVVLWLHCSQRGRNPRVSSSHFLGKSEPLPSIQPDTELFKDGRTLTHKTRRTHCWGTCKYKHTPLMFIFPRIYCWQSSRTWWRTPSPSL